MGHSEPQSPTPPSTNSPSMFPRRCILVNSWAPFTLFSSIAFFLREFLTIVSLAFGILFAFLFVMRDASAEFLASTYDISNPELLVLVMTITALVLSLFSATAAVVRWWHQPYGAVVHYDEEVAPVMAQHMKEDSGPQKSG